MAYEQNVEQPAAEAPPVPQLPFYDEHNREAYLEDPPPKHREFQSLITGLNTCRLSYALRAAPSICETFIRDFWNTATLDPNGAGGAGALVGTVQNTSVTISEAMIREVLQFQDLPAHPIEYPRAAVIEVLTRMSYEGNYPPLVKKLLHPYWKLLIHYLQICISGGKGQGGTDTVTKEITSAAVALTMGWNYNFSKLVFEEMKRNVTGIKKQMFLMYPRFLQLIFDARYPGLERTVEILDMKVMPGNIFGLIKQVRRGTKNTFMGNRALEKFGIFAEIGQPAVIQNAIIAEEQDVQQMVIAPAEQNLVNEEVEHPEVFELRDSDGEEVETVSVSEPVVTAHHSDALPTPEQLQALLDKLQGQKRIPPPIMSPAGIDEEDESESDSGLIQRKRRKLDPRPGIVIQKQTPTPISKTSTILAPTEPTTSTTTTTTAIDTPVVASDPVFDFEENEQDFDFDFDMPLSLREKEKESSSSTKGKEREEINLQELLRKYTGEDYAGRGKNKEGEPSTLEDRVEALENVVIAQEVHIQDLESEVKNKDEEIVDLQCNLGALTAMVLNMRQKLNQKFAGEFPDTDDEGENNQEGGGNSGFEESTQDQSRSGGAEQSHPSTENDNTDFGTRLDKDPRTEAEIEKSRQLAVDEEYQREIEGYINTSGASLKQRKLMLIKSREAAKVRREKALAQAAATEAVMIPMGESMFDRVGNRSGVLVWGYDNERKMWFVKRREGDVEYYDKSSDFTSFTKVDLSALANAPWYNPTRDRRGELQRQRIVDQSKKGFPDMKTAKSDMFSRKFMTNEKGYRVWHARWPATHKRTSIPLMSNHPEGVLSDMEFWALNPTDFSITIKCRNQSFTIFDKRDLLRFSVTDLKVLSVNQIITEPEFEYMGKDWAGHVKDLLEKKEQGATEGDAVII